MRSKTEFFFRQKNIKKRQGYSLDGLSQQKHPPDAEALSRLGGLETGSWVLMPGEDVFLAGLWGPAVSLTKLVSPFPLTFDFSFFCLLLLLGMIFVDDLGMFLIMVWLTL